MRDAVSRKRQQKKLSIKQLGMLLFFLLLLLLLYVTISFSIPVIYSFLYKERFLISPLGAGISRNDAQGEMVTQDSIKRKARKLGLVIKDIQRGSDMYLLVLEKGEKVMLSDKKPLDEQLASLQLISSRLTIEGKHFTLLDLRFDRPILVLK